MLFTHSKVSNERSRAYVLEFRSHLDQVLNIDRQLIFIIPKTSHTGIFFQAVDHVLEGREVDLQPLLLLQHGLQEGLVLRVEVVVRSFRVDRKRLKNKKLSDDEKKISGDTG